MLVRFPENSFIGGIQMKGIVCINSKILYHFHCRGPASVLVKRRLYSGVIRNNRCLRNVNVASIFIRNDF